MKCLHQVDLHELAFILQCVTGELLEVTEHHAKQGQGLDFAEQQRFLAAQDGCIAFWMLFRRIESTREALGQGDTCSLLCHMTSFLCSFVHNACEPWPESSECPGQASSTSCLNRIIFCLRSREAQDTCKTHSYSKIFPAIPSLPTPTLPPHIHPTRS